MHSILFDPNTSREVRNGALVQVLLKKGCKIESIHNIPKVRPTRTITNEPGVTLSLHYLRGKEESPENLIHFAYAWDIPSNTPSVEHGRIYISQEAIYKFQILQANPTQRRGD